MRRGYFSSACILLGSWLLGCSYMPESEQSRADSVFVKVAANEGTGGNGPIHPLKECSTQADCPGIITPCKWPVCAHGACTFAYEPRGNGTEEQTRGDCRANLCDGFGALVAINATYDISDDGNPCTEDLCDSGSISQPIHVPSAARTKCSVNGGRMCDGAGSCVECISGTDCVSGVCQQNGCVPASCADNTLNGQETDVDCGGAECGDCADGRICALGADCLSHVCTAGTCASPACNDQIENGSETDIDCGGITCAPCGPNEECSVDADCTGGSCSGAYCLPTCTDGVKNANETDIDCGGPTCAPCAIDLACSISTDCTSLVCENGTCAAPSCGDTIHNGSETDVDCGGNTCGPCSDGLVCNVASDCVSGVCLGAICQMPSCQDNVKNGGEFDVDCGGGCPTGCAAGTPCVLHTDCAFNACVEGFCQATSCGNGVVDATEACDDGNIDGGDCCAVNCQLEPDCEIEPNGQITSPNTLPSSGTMKAQIIPAGDGDYFRFTVANTSDVQLEIFEGYSGSSCPTAHTAIELVHPMFGTIASDLDDGPGGCSRIHAFPDAGARRLTPGINYYIHVWRPDGLELPAYHLVLTTIAECGDGVKEGTEQCDDGNTTDRDGCSSSCVLDTSWEMEPNNCPMPNGLYDLGIQDMLVSGAISPIGDKDCFAFTLPARADVAFETFDGSGPGSCNAIDTQLQLYDANCGSPLGTAQDWGGIGACAKLDPAFDNQVRHLSAGTYAICVNDSGNDDTISGHTLLGTVTALCGNQIEEGTETCDHGPGGSSSCSPDCQRYPRCGDGFRDNPEACDDGNTLSGDGCNNNCTAVEMGYVCGFVGGTCLAICGDNYQTTSEACDSANRANGDGDFCDSACTPELAPTAETEPNDSYAYANVNPAIANISTTLTGAITPTGDRDIFKFVLPSASVVRFETFDNGGVTCTGAIHTDLRVINSSFNLVGFAPTGTGIAGCAQYVRYLNAGTYYVQVEESGNNATIGAYKLQVKILSNSGAESEMNDNVFHADPAVGGDYFVSGSHQIQSDPDFYAVVVPAGRSLRAEIIEGDESETCESYDMDSYMELYDPTGTQLLASDHDDGRGGCSLIDGTGTAAGISPRDFRAANLSAGTYYLQVRASAAVQDSPRGQFEYRLAVTIR